MKVIKRDGRAVEFDGNKIAIAIEKANAEVKGNKKATKKQIKQIIAYIEDLDKKRILVEDIQDIIEEKLMEIKKFELAKKYIVYRYTRALVRKQNTTDKSILGIIKNINNNDIEQSERKNTAIASIQRDLIAGEVSKDLTNRILLPEKISKAHQEGVLYFHDADYFLQPIFNSSSIDVEDMLENGIAINGKLIEAPKDFNMACIVTAQILMAAGSSQYGELSFDVKALAKFLCKNKEQLQLGVHILLYQINTLITASGRAPKVSIFMNLDESYEYANEEAQIIEELFKQYSQGIKNEVGEYEDFSFPKLIYVLDECNCLKGGKYDYLTKLALKCAKASASIYFISAKKMRESYGGNVPCPCGSQNFLMPWKDEEGKYKNVGRFNQGIVTINLPQVAIAAEKNEVKFWKELEERLELCYEALMCRHYSLLGTVCDVSPIHWRYGAITRLEKGTKIDKFLYNGYSALSLGYTGLAEVTDLITKSDLLSQNGTRFACKLLKKLQQTISEWSKETNVAFTLYNTDSGQKAKADDVDVYDRLKIESKFQKLTLGGDLLHVNIAEVKDLNEFIDFVYENIQYVALEN